MTRGEQAGEYVGLFRSVRRNISRLRVVMIGRRDLVVRLRRSRSHSLGEAVVPLPIFPLRKMQSWPADTLKLPLKVPL